MKKLIAISMMIALVAGAAFAQANIGFTLDTRFSIAGSTAEGNKPQIGGSIADAYLEASGENDDGTLGGLVRLAANGQVGGTTGSTNTPAEGVGHSHSFATQVQFHRAFIWWKPIDQLKIFLGKEKNGLYSTGDPLTDWAFHQGAENYLNFHEWGYWRSVFPGNWDTFGLAFEIYPIEGLNINLVIPTGTSDWPNDVDGRTLAVEDLIYNLQLQVNYNIAGIGTVYVSYMGQGKSDYTDGNFGASFLLDGPVEGLKAQVGVSTGLYKGGAEGPLLIGLAAHYASGDFGVKFRSAFEIGYATGNAAQSTFGGYGGPIKGMGIQFNVMPWYNLGVLEARVDFGLRMVMPTVGDQRMAWHLNPYARVPIPGGRFQFGFKVAGNDTPNSIINWSIPMGLVFGF